MKRRLYWDLECSGLEANWSNLLTVGFQVEGEPVTVLKINDYPKWNPYDDKRLIQEFLKTYSRDDVGVEITHYGTLFDLPYLQARMAYHGLGTLPVVGHVDTFFIAKSKLKIKGRSLGSIAEFLRCRYRKTPLSPDVWRRAGRGDEKALEYIGRHNAADVRVLRQVYERLAPLMRRHPVMGDYGSCHACGKDSLQKRGFYTTIQRGRQERFVCTHCGSWTHRPEPKRKKTA